MIDDVRVGVVGTSWYLDWMHLPLLKSHAQVQIVAVFGRNQARAWELAGKYGIPQVFSDYREMMTRELLDAVVIAVPDDLHYPITMAALDAGLHVLCENPLAFNLAQAREMLAKAEAEKVKHMTFFTWRWAPYVRLVQQLIREGYLGELYHAQFEWMGGYARSGAYQWKWDSQHGLGVLGELGSHMIDLAHLLVGDIALVNARLDTRVARLHPSGHGYEPSNDTASLNLQFANGATGTIFTSAVMEVGGRVQTQRIQLAGSEGTLEVTADRLGYAVRGLRHGEAEYKVFSIPPEFLAGSAPNFATWEDMMQVFSRQSIGTRQFIDGILTDCPVEPSFVDGVKAQSVIEAALRSHGGGCWVAVE